MSRTCTKCGHVIMSETDSSCLNCGAELPPIKIEEDYDKDFEKKEKINKNLIGYMYFFVILFALFTICALFNFDFLSNNLISYLIWIVILCGYHTFKFFDAYK